MKLAVLLSGGKDSIFSLYKMLQKGNEIKYLVTIFPENPESWLFHHPCIELTKFQAKSLGIKQVIKKTKGEKEKELEDLKKILKKIKNKIDGLVSGVMFSNYQKSRIDKICEEIGIKNIAPLWHKDPLKILMAESKEMEIIITGVFSEGLDKRWLGRKIDGECIEELKELNKKFGINLTGEGGEFETFVLDCPLFKKKIKIEKLDIIWDKKTNSGYLSVKKVRLIPKAGMAEPG